MKAKLFENSEVKLLSTYSLKYKFISFDEELDVIRFNFIFKYKQKKFFRTYGFIKQKDKLIDEYYKDLSIAVLNDYKNGSIKRQIEYELHKKI